MMKLILTFLVALIVALPGVVITAAPASADSITFWVASDHPYPVRLEFSSADESDRYWPGDGLSYPLHDYEAHSFKLNCRTGERICYGAWEEGGETRWGVGHQQDTYCESCCYECNGGEVDLITLLAP